MVRLPNKSRGHGTDVYMGGVLANYMSREISYGIKYGIKSILCTSFYVTCRKERYTRRNHRHDKVVRSGGIHMPSIYEIK